MNRGAVEGHGRGEMAGVIPGAGRAEGAHAGHRFVDEDQLVARAVGEGVQEVLVDPEPIGTGGGETRRRGEEPHGAVG